MSLNWEIIITIVEVIIAILQFYLVWKMNRQTLSKDKGYFIMQKTNISKEDDEDYKQVIFLYNLKKPLFFKLYGNGDVVLISEQITFNNIIVKTIEPRDQFLSIHDNSPVPYGIELPLNENNWNKERLDVDITWKLKNLMGYKYTQIIHLEFVRNSNATLWELKRQNMEFKE